MDADGPPGPGGPPDAGPPAAPGGPPGAGGSPILAALARARGAPQASAPGQGAQAAALQQVKMALDMLQNALPSLGTGSEVHRDVINAVSRLSRHMPQGIPTAGAQQGAVQDLMRNTIRNAMLQRVMANQQGGQGGGQQPMPPSTPLPGA